jgi:hypothetical protein
MEEMGDELGSPIAGDVCGNSVFGEDVNDEKSSEFWGIDFIHSGDEDALFR